MGFYMTIAHQEYLAVMPAAGGPIRNSGIGNLKGLSDPVWSPDSTKLAFISNHPFENRRFDPTAESQWGIYSVDIRAGEVQRLINDKAMEMHIDWR